MGIGPRETATCPCTIQVIRDTVNGCSCCRVVSRSGMPYLECGDLSPLSFAAEPLSVQHDESKVAVPQTQAVTSHRTPKVRLK
jgi:hypothetical protein